MITFNKMKQLLYFSICFLSNVLIINYLPNVYLNTSRPIKITTLVVLVLRYKVATTMNHCF